MKRSHIITYIIGIILMLVSYAYFIFVYHKEDTLTFYLHTFHLAGILFILLPLAFEVIFKRNFPLYLIVAFYVFIFSSQIWGSAYHGYNTFEPLDAIVHGFSGALSVFIIAELSKKHIESSKLLYNLLYLLAMGILVGVIWEIIEYCGDLWLGMNNQVFKSNGVEFVGQAALKDTMIDLIADLIGSIVAATIIVLLPLLNKAKIKNEQN